MGSFKSIGLNRMLWLWFGFGMGVMFTLVLQSAAWMPNHAQHHMHKRDIKATTRATSSSNLTDTMNQFGDPGDGRDFIARDEYLLSYSRRDRVPSWTFEHLTAQSLVAGQGVNRSNSAFKEDPAIMSIFRSLLADYSGSGYDRGHTAPAGDAVATQEAMDQTFFLSNMSPQVGVGFNRQYWAYLENFVRSLTGTFSDVYVYTGPAFIPQKSGTTFTMSYPVLNGNTAVPTHFYKVLLVPHGSGYASAAFLLPNQKIDSSTALTSFKVDVQVIEKASGLVFFSKLSSLDDLCSLTTCTVTK
ncbi:hypothetical protein DM01DRAFT_1335104 [Hesseltinella vesiculosa]|uniref:Endonuclease n=1 Tax=Hesseltinella vesiculosa TaxID=101127 RepID=A0A1X2GK88_9FUNG|nr:hypothetical protein DM01DRAFT_1335104 [Hesseltinella vesiculosa]